MIYFISRVFLPGLFLVYILWRLIFEHHKSNHVDFIFAFSVITTESQWATRSFSFNLAKNQRPELIPTTKALTNAWKGYVKCLKSTWKGKIQISPALPTTSASFLILLTSWQIFHAWFTKGRATHMLHTTRIGSKKKSTSCFDDKPRNNYLLITCCYNLQYNRLFLHFRSIEPLNFRSERDFQ